jgi:hypothetical protein
MAKAQNVLPGDYDESNNSITGEIMIANPVASLFYQAGASERTQTNDFTEDQYFLATSTVPDKHSRDIKTTVRQARYFHGWIAAAVNLPLNKVSYTDSSDGAALNSLSYANLGADYTLPSLDPAYTTVSYASGYDSVSCGTLTIRRYANATTGVGLTTIDVSYDGGDVTYHSEKYCKSVAGAYTCTPGDYTVNPDRTEPLGPGYGPKVKFGANYAADFLLDDGTVYKAHPSTTLTTSNSSWSVPRYCYPLTAPNTCRQINNTTVAKSGTDARLQ